MKLLVISTKEIDGGFRHKVIEILKKNKKIINDIKFSAVLNSSETEAFRLDSISFLKNLEQSLENVKLTEWD